MPPPTATAPAFDYDVFISYSSHDKAWVRGELLTQLEAAGLKLIIDFRDFRPGAPIIKEMERAVTTSRKTLLILTPAYLASMWTEFENLMLQTLDPTNRTLRLIPLLKEGCELPIHLSYLGNVDFTDPNALDLAWRKLLTGLGPPSSTPAQGTATLSLHPNPFINTGAIHEPDQFIGRTMELRRLTNMLTGGSVALLGTAKVGKSSLLRQLARCWPGPVLGPIDCMGVQDRDDFYQQLAEGLQLTDMTWRAIDRALRQQPALLLLDELDVAPERGLTVDDLRRFRVLCDANRRFQLVTVSRVPLKQLFSTKTGSEPYNLIQPLTLGPLTNEEARQLLAHPWVPDAPHFNEAVCDEVQRMAANHPFKLQRAAYHRYESMFDPIYDWAAAYAQDLEHML